MFSSLKYTIKFFFLLIEVEINKRDIHARLRISLYIFFVCYKATQLYFSVHHIDKIMQEKQAAAAAAAEYPCYLQWHCMLLFFHILRCVCGWSKERTSIVAAGRCGGIDYWMIIYLMRKYNIFCCFVGFVKMNWNNLFFSSLLINKTYKSVVFFSSINLFTDLKLQIKFNWFLFILYLIYFEEKKNIGKIK